MSPKDADYIEVAYRRTAEKKTHVSFPQLKYPSLRDEGLKDATQWLMGKAMDDGAEGLWRVHNGLYDLSNFIKRHPGGEEWLELSKGTDITEAFECHHFDPSVWKTLEKFYIRDAKTPRNSPFTFKDDGFYRTLKRDVTEELKKVPTNVPRRADMIIDGLLITLLITSALSCWSKDYWVSMVSYLVASVSLAWMVVASHNYIHRKTNWRMYLFNLSMWSYRDFRVSHVLSHHMYPNTLMDLEISVLEPIIFFNPRKQPVLANYAILIEQFLFPFSFFLNFVKRFILNSFRKGFTFEHYRWHDGVGFILPIWIWIVSGETLSNAFYSWFWIICTASYIFFSIGYNVGHHHPKVFKDGDQVRDITPDWGMHELETVMGRKDINKNIFWILTFFGEHSLHHLFPTLDHAVLPYLYPVFLEHCKNFRANFRETESAFDLVVGQIQQTLKTEPSLLED